MLLAVIGPFFVANPNQLSHTELAPPSLSHWLGTTQIGQDVFAQLVVSARASLLIGVGAGLLATVVSIVVGISGGYAGGIVDEVLNLFSNVVLVIPTLPLVIVIIADVKSNGLGPLIVVIALTSWAAAARVLRAQTLSVRNREYVLAARAAGRARLADRVRRDHAQRAADHRVQLHLRHDLRDPHPGRPGVHRPG